MQVKAILVAGGHGCRLYPFTRYTHKTLLPLHRRPVIDYALGTIRRAGITDITIIGNRFIGQIAQHVGTGLPGENIHYVIEEEPRGVKYALDLARSHVKNCRIMVYFSDNITTANMDAEVEHFRSSEAPPGCVLLGREVEDPERFGVGVFDEDGNLSNIIEKPDVAPSKMAIGGIYLYDERFWDIFDSMEKEFGEKVTISDVNKKYIDLGCAQLKDLGQEVWIDCGTPDALQEGAVLAKLGVLNCEPCNIREGDAVAFFKD